MKTLTIQLPDELCERAARQAAARGYSLEQAFVMMLERFAADGEDVVDVRKIAPKGTPEGRLRVYEIMARRFNSEHHDTAKRHNEHHP